MNNLTDISKTKRTVKEIVAMLLDKQDSIDGITVIINSNGESELSSAGSWSNLCIAAVMVNDYAMEVGRQS